MKKVSTQETRSSRNRVMLVALASFLFGVLLTGAVIAFVQARESPKVTAVRQSDIPTAVTEYQFIDPLIGIRGVNTSTKYNAMENQVASYIAGQKNDGLVTASVDFRDINESGGFVLNPSELYTPASLNKVPLMMAYYKIAEANPAILSQNITYTGATNDDDIEEIKSAVQLTPGTTYTVEELIEHMIRYSDNNAANLLLQYLTDTSNLSAYVAVFSDLGADQTVLSENTDNATTTGDTDNMTVGEYSVFLRALYNAAYLDRDDSERALQLLSETDFTEGIESGVPNGVLVAQKFGEVRLVSSSGTLLGKELHNCGIVYYPDHPYLLCIMTKATGDNIPALESDIASISSIVYKNMQTLYP